MTSKLDCAKQYALEGKKVFPCQPNGKVPLTLNGYKDASSDVADIEAWWDAYPEANIGFTTGRDNDVAVIDVDVKGNAKGLESFAQLMQEGITFDTKSVKTPSGGFHYYFLYPKGVDVIKNRVNVRPGIDVRGDGGYVLAPNSSINDEHYANTSPGKEIAEMPAELLDVITGTPDKKLATTAGMSKVQEGARNDHVFKVASKLRGDDVPFDLAKSQVLLEAQMCEPPLPDSEALRCLDSAYTLYQPNTKNPTDVGNAKRLIQLFGINLKYVIEFNKWTYWNGSRWVFDDSGYMMRCAKNTARAIIEEAKDELDDGRRMSLMKHAINSENRQRLEAMIDVAKSEDGVTISQSELDQDEYLLGVSNGVVNLRTGFLLDSAKDKMITKQAHVEFKPEAECPRWIQFINEITGDDAELADYLQKVIGYSLTGDTKEQKLFFLYGHGANGKSVFVKTIQRMLGDYAMQTPVSTIMTKGKGSINNDVARLRGARFVATTETEEGSKFNESEVKLLTGGDRIAARFLHQEFFEFAPQFKLWISGNYKPVTGDGYGIWRRLILVPFNIKFDGDKKDKHLEDKLKAEFSGILNWSIEGCLKWQEEGLTTPSAITSATQEYRSEMDRVNSWMEECCIENADANDSEKASDLYQSYREWARQNGEWEMSQRLFGNRLADKGFMKKKTSKGYCYYGIQLLPHLHPRF